jgi:hypothetical protein
MLAGVGAGAEGRALADAGAEGWVLAGAGAEGWALAGALAAFCGLVVIE